MMFEQENQRNEVRIAVLLSSYNGEKYIVEQIESILNQQLKNALLHIYVRDDGSTDRTVELVKNMAEADERIHIRCGQNIGSNASYFTLIHEVSGYDFYAFSDQDDVWDEDKIQTAVDQLMASGKRCVLYGSPSRLTNEALEPYGLTQTMRRPITLYNSLIQNFLPGHSQVMDDALLKVLAKINNYEGIHVYDSFITNMAVIHGSVLFDNTPHTRYRQHQNNQIGFGDQGSGWIINRLKRIKKNESHLYARQIAFIRNGQDAYLSPDEKNEIDQFLSEGGFLTRLGYVLRSKLFRQRKLETLAFKLLYLLGGYTLP